MVQYQLGNGPIWVHTHKQPVPRGGRCPFHHHVWDVDVRGAKTATQLTHGVAPTPEGTAAGLVCRMPHGETEARHIHWKGSGSSWGRDEPSSVDVVVAG